LINKWLSQEIRLLSRDYAEFKHNLLSYNKGDLVSVSEINELLTEDPLFWKRIKNTFAIKFRMFDNILLKLHYKRNLAIDKTSAECILKFLTIGYLLSNDVRYFNELLFYRYKGLDNYVTVCLEHFRDCLFDGVHHHFPLATTVEVEQFITHFGNDMRTGLGQLFLPPRNQCKIGLLGNPVNFRSMYTKLDAINLPCVALNFAYRKTPWKRYFWKNYYLTKIYLRLKGVQFPYNTIFDFPLSTTISQKLSLEGIWIAIHRLGFIIKNNIINSIKVGILNDHLAVLPFIRGRSTVEYSILFGLPVASTIHFIDEGVDTGPLIRIFIFKENIKGKSLEEIKKLLIENSDARFIETVNYLIDEKPRPGANIYEHGLQYFVINPELKRYVENLLQ
jgi:hypothetical protein